MDIQDILVMVVKVAVVVVLAIQVVLLLVDTPVVMDVVMDGFLLHIEHLDQTLEVGLLVAVVVLEKVRTQSLQVVGEVVGVDLLPILAMVPMDKDIKTIVH